MTGRTRMDKADGEDAPPRPPFRWDEIGMSRLALQIIVLKLTGLAVLFVATLNQLALREHAADTFLAALTVQADTVAALVEGEAGAPLARVETVAAIDDGAPDGLQTVIERDRIERVLSEVMEGSRARVQLWGVDGALLADSRFALRRAADVTAAPLPLLDAATVERAPEEGVPSEVAAALGGIKTAVRRRTGDDLVVATAGPLLGPLGEVIGAVLVSSGRDAVLASVRDQERAVVNGFLVAGGIAVVLSLVLAAMINRPLARLAFAAERVKGGAGAQEIPELGRADTIGQLSREFRDMAMSLTQRMAATEAFAAEVAHELKNPLTSLRSAVETLPLAKKEQSRQDLLQVIAHDVRRIDRLISDISDASRLDSELARARFARFDLVHLLETVVASQQELGRKRGQAVSLQLRSKAAAFVMIGNNSRLGQVFTNLLDNARSFTPDGGDVIVSATRFERVIEVIVDDEGPGIDEPALEKIFDRFYTDRPDEAQFGNNSGLGLAISRQVVVAHGGEIFAENRYRTTLSPGRHVSGARFTVRLPV